jgi:7-cyano-7-deazaguanine synthase
MLHTNTNTPTPTPTPTPTASADTLNRSALVLFSGGQDSTTCLAWALARYARVETIGFEYGQKHAIEMTARQTVLKQLRQQFPAWNDKLGEDHVLDLGVLGQMSDTALTRETAIAFDASGLPNTFVPGRNLLFLTFAAALAYRRGQSVIVGGMCETDFSGYPDCRDDTIKAQQVAVSLGMGQRFTFETPLMWLDKAQTWRLAFDLGGQALEAIVLEDSHTCYHGVRGTPDTRHAWGYGCAVCPACELRAKGFATYQARSLQSL